MSIKKNITTDDPEDIVISGISGEFPNCENVEKFKKYLLEGVDMISPVDRTNRCIRRGLLKSIDRFDHSFFGLTREQAEFSTISSRKLLEKTFEAILDAGYNPKQIKGKNIAVVAGTWDASDLGDPAWNKYPNDFSTNISRYKFMLTNRISYWLDIHGPSFPLNTACSSSSYALDSAVQCMQGRQCEAAIVCASNFSFPDSDHQSEVLAVSKDKCTPFDANANGYIRSEAVVVMFLQKRKDARRIYTTIAHTSLSSDGFKKEGIFHPSVEQQIKLYEQFYKEVDFDPQNIAYLEAHGTGTQVGDVVEGTSIDEFFCKNRNKPLKIGSVKSNMGHSEAAATLCSVIKMIISFESGILPANIHYKTPNPNIKGLHNGHLEVVTKPAPLEGEYFAINSYGIGGSNGHIVLKPHKKIKKINPLSNTEIPKLVMISGRSQEAVEFLLKDVEKNSNDAEYIRLLHEIFSEDISGHLQRGFIIVNNKKKENITSKKVLTGQHRPVWFIFSGMGSQWPAMGKSLMEVPIFKHSIQKSHRVLQSKGIDLIRIITENDAKIFDNILNSFVGIAAIQIALVDVLKELKLQPDGIIGHSVGELGCAYADECFTAEQMILIAYYRGLVSIETKFIHGAMAAVGQGYETMRNLIPPEIDIACHNSADNCTISGPAQIMQDFSNELMQKNILVRSVNTSNIAYHSRYIAAAESKFISYLKKIIPEPRLRSHKWICSSALEKEWNLERVLYSSAEYHTNNLLNPVYFEEGCKHIPSNAITIEIAPHGLLNTILKRSLPSTVDKIPLTLKNNENGVEFLLNSLGRIYEAGCTFNASILYPPIEFPVSRSTPMISPLIKWQHEEEWQVDKINSDEFSSSERNFFINTNNENYAFIKDHIIDGRNLYPGIGYLWLVVETMAMIKKKKITDVSVVFENIHLERATNVSEKATLKFRVFIQMKNNYFEVTESSIVVATGTVRYLEDTTEEVVDEVPRQDDLSKSKMLPLNTKDFYKEMRLKGYDYKELFKAVKYVNCEGTYGEVAWSNNFITFIDCIAQILLFGMDCRELILPTFMQKIVIDFKKHFEILHTLDIEQPKFPVKFYPNHGLLSAGGIQLRGFKGNVIARQKNQADPVLEKYLFVSYISDEVMSLNLAIKICVHIALKNSPTIRVTTYELLDQNNVKIPTISVEVLKTLKNLPVVEANVNVIVEQENSMLQTQDVPDEIAVSNEKLPSDKSSLLIIALNLHKKTNLLESIIGALKNNGFIITVGSLQDESFFQNIGFNVCFRRNINASEKIYLLAKMVKMTTPIHTVRIKNDSFSWMFEIQNRLAALRNEESAKLVVYAEKEPLNGILGFFNCLRKEDNGTAVRCFFIIDENAPDFTLEDQFYKSQFDKNLCHNVYKNEQWGTYCHLPLDPVEDVETIHAFCALQERGNLSSFKWFEGPLNPFKYVNAQGKSLVHIYYSSLNFRDVMLAVRKMSTIDLTGYSRLFESYEGIEFSGKDENEVRLMGMLICSGIATMAEPAKPLVWKIPDKMTLEDAATIPVVYATVILAFFFNIQLKKGCSILIHAGSGGIGQAAINICLHYGCNIFTTVSTADKAKFIREAFPQIPDNHIGNSRDTSFEKLIMNETNGVGVDIVLNSLAEDKLRASVRCLAMGGHFLEIGKSDMLKNNSLELGYFLRNITFHSIQLDLLLATKDRVLIDVQQKMQDMIDQGVIKPLHRTIFESNEVESAFRYMAAGKHIGKVVIKIRDEQTNFKTTPILKHIKASPRVTCQANNTYLIIGGLGGFGMELTDWLILRGARNIILSSRSGLKNGYQSHRIKIWNSYGVNIVISTEDITTELGVKNLLLMATSIGPLVGIFNLALILKDGPFAKQSEDSFHAVIGPKSTATIHLDKLSRIMCPNLEHFVVFSSVVCGHGNFNQTNYGFANSVMERICERRRDDGLPALAIQWGAIGEVGVVAEFIEDNISFIISGTLLQNVKSCLETLNLFMKQQNPIVSSMIVAEKNHVGTDIINTVANILGIKDLKTINETWTLPELGMDSIVAMELKQILGSEFNIFFTSKELQNMTFAKLYHLKKERDSMNKTDKKIASLLEFSMEDLLNQPALSLPLTTNQLDGNYKMTNSDIFIFPGLEGMGIGMQPLVVKLGIRALCFQYNCLKILKLSIQEMSEYYAQLILKQLGTNEEFNILGYSFGGLLTLEVVNILEKNGKTGRVWLIESSPSFLKTLLATETNKFANVSFDEALQNRVCVQIIKIIRPNMTETQYNKCLGTSNQWEEKKKSCFSVIRPSIKEEHGHRLFDGVYNRCKLVLTYQEISSVKLASCCVLIRCARNEFDIDELYGLNEHFENPPESHKIEDVNHYGILTNFQFTEIIRKTLLHK